jgi:hypothetical protein
MNSPRLLFQMLLLCLGWSWVSAQDDVIVPEGFRLLENARLIPDDDVRTAQLHGQDFDRLVKSFYKKLELDGIATPITRTFAGDKIENGWRIGNKEIWLQKRTPALGTSLDIIIWDLEMDNDGNVKAARGIGMDHHTVHPESPRALASHKEHWKEKKTTRDFWVNALKKQRPEIDVTLEMDPDNSFYWREAADRPEVDEFTRERSRLAGDRHGHQLGHSIFVGSAVRILGGTMATVNAAAAGLALIEALKKVYNSPILAKTFALLQEGKYREARINWESRVINDTRSAEFDEFREALAGATSVLSIRTFVDFPDAMRLLFEKWESDAKKEFGEPVLEPPKVIHLGDGAWATDSPNAADMRKERLVGRTWKTDFALGEIREFSSAELIFGEVKGINTGGKVTINDSEVGQLNRRGHRVSVWIGGTAALKENNTVQVEALADRVKGIDDFEFEGVWIKLIPRESDPTVGGKYSDLLHKIPCPEDKSDHGNFEDWSNGGKKWEKTEYQDYTDLKPGYWVWVYPHWYVWAKTTESN